METKYESYNYLIVPNEMIKYNRTVEHNTFTEYLLDEELVAVLYKNYENETSPH